MVLGRSGFGLRPRLSGSIPARLTSFNQHSGKAVIHGDESIVPGIQHLGGEDFGLKSADADDRYMFVDLQNCIARGTRICDHSDTTSNEAGLRRPIATRPRELAMVEDQHA